MAIYAVDFDGTLAVTRFPEIVEPKRKAVAAVKMLKANGHKVILWTSRAGRDLEAAYIKGYMTAELRERERRKKARERKKRKRYFLTQKLYGVAMLILTAVSVKLLEGDITVAFILVPMGIVLITSKEMVIVNKYFWECEGKEWYL